MIRHAPKSEWRRVGSGAIRVEILPNGDEVACASRWNPPDPFGGVSSEKIAAVAELVRTGAYRADTRSRDWIGYAVAEVIGIPVSYGADNDQKDLTRLHDIIRKWLKNKILKIVSRRDTHRKERDFVTIGPGIADCGMSAADVFPDDDDLIG